MTLGQRIQELRKQRGMSQESLGHVLGVSRQAVSKWEGDNGIPELDTIIAMSRLFDVTIGQLLGVEETAAQKNETTGDMDQDEAESVLRRYAAQTTGKDVHSRFTRWGKVVAEAIVITTVFVVMFAQLTSLRSTVKLLQHDLANLQVTVSNNQNNLSGQIRSAIYGVLAEEAKLLSTLEWEILDLDLINQTAALRLNATMKEYAAGSQLQFCAEWHKVDGTTGETTGDWVEGPNFQSDIILPLNHTTNLSIRVRDGEGNMKEQLLQDSIYELHPNNFCLYARNLTTPFAITVKSFAFSDTTAKGEQANIVIESIYPDFIRPEKAVITAYVNGVEVMSEITTISPSESEKQVFHAAIQDTYFDLTLKDGDKLEVTLVTTDNLGRIQQFSDCIQVKNGELERSPGATPVISPDK